MSDTSAPAGPGNAGSAFLEIIPTVAAGAAGMLAGGLAGPLKAAAGMLSNPAVAIGAALGAAITAGIGTAIDVAGELGKGQKEIRKLTGAVGSDLTELGASFRDIVGTVAGQGIDRFAEAIGRLNARTNLTGPALEGLAQQELRLAKLTGEDLAGTIETTTRMFGDWGVATENQAASLDFLYKAGQNTGVGVNQLAATVTKFGAPLRQLGFSLEESTALVGSFEKQGVNTNLVLGSMRIALGKMAKAGEEPVGTFRRLVGEIESAGTAGEANSIALQLFGSRAGPDMAAAIREGRLNIGELLAQIGETPKTLEQTEKETRSWSERMGVMWQRASLWFEPLGKSLLDFRTNIVGRLEKGFEALSKLMSGDTAGAGVDIGKWLGFDEDSAAVDGLIRTFDVVRDFIRDLREGGLGQAFSNLGRNIADAWPAISAGLRELLDRIVENLTGWSVTIGQAVISWGQAIASWAVDAIPAALEAYRNFEIAVWTWILETYAGLVERVRSWIPALTAWVTDAWPVLVAALAVLWANLSTWVDGQVAALRATFNTWAPVVAGWVTAAWEQTSTALTGYLASLRAEVSARTGDLGGTFAGWARAAGTWITDAAGRIGEFLGPYLAALGAWIVDNAPRLLEQFHDWATNAGRWIGEAIPALLDSAGQLLGSLLTWIVDNGPKVLTAVADLIPKILTAIVEWAPKIVAGLAVVLFNIVRFVVELAGPLLLALGGLLVKLVGWILFDALPKLVGALPEWIGAFISWIPGAIVALLAALGGLLASLGAWLLETGLPALAALLGQWAAAFVDWVPGAIASLLGKLGELLGAIVTWAVTVALPGLVETLLSWAFALVGWILTAIIGLPVMFGKLQVAIAEFIIGAIPWLIEQIATWVPAILSFIVGAIAAAPGMLAEFAGMLLGWIAGMPEKIAAAAAGMFKGIANAFVWVVNAIHHLWNDLRLTIPPLEVGGKTVWAGATLDTPDIADIPALARGGRAIAPGLAVVGERGAEILSLARGDTVLPPDALAAGNGGRMFGDVNITEAPDVETILARLDAQLAWRVGTGRNG
jgi:TP901 family phage tail tape measure protein